MAELTDLDGVGPKTAEGLKSKGYRSKEELIEAYREGRLLNSDVPSRVETAIQKDLLDRGESFTDPRSGLEISPDNRGAFEVFGSRGTNDSIDWFGRVSRNFSKYQDTTLLDLGGFAAKGELGADLSPSDYEDIGYTNYRGNNRKSKKNTGNNRAQSARKRAFEMGLDAAANLTGFDREDLEEGNQLARDLGKGRRRKGATLETGFTYEKEVSRAGKTRSIEKNERVDRREFAAASTVHSSRSPRARRVDERKDAPITTDLDEWASAPSRWDYPGVDTPGGRSDFTSDNERSRADEAIEAFEKASQGAKRVALGDVDGSLLGSR